MENTKGHLIRVLLEDFISNFPTSSRAERLEVFSRLHLFEIADLELLVSQLKKENQK